MASALVRLLKGQFMGLMFLLFGFGILLEVLLVSPVLRLLARFQGPDPARMQAVHRFLMGLWLWGLKLGGLLTVLPPVGKPMAGPCVMVANHPGLFDIVVLIRDIPKLSVLVKRSLAEKLPLKSVFRLSGYVCSPDYGTAGAAFDTVNEALSCLEQGHKFMMFPEGTRSPAQGPGRFKAGAFKIARKANVPIQPVLLRNNPRFMTHESRWYFPPRQVSTLQFEFQAPLPPPEPDTETEAARALEERFAEELGTIEAHSGVAKRDGGL